MTQRKKGRTQRKKPKPNLEKNITKTNRIKAFFRSTLGIITIVVTVLGLIQGFDFLYNKYKKATTSPQKTFEDETTIKGILLPEDFDEKNPVISFKLGSATLVDKLHFFSEGVTFTPSVFKYQGTPFINLHFQILNRRLYVSDTIRYIENQEIVGIINFDQWTLFKSNMLSYIPNDKYLEVIDKQGNVALSLSFVNGNTLSINGYFITDAGISGLSENAAMMRIKDKKRAMYFIRNIKPIGQYFKQ